VRAVLAALAAAALLLVLPAETHATNPQLTATVGPGFTISLVDANSQPVTSVPAGTYDITVHDLSSEHNFHLTGPGVNKDSGLVETGTTTWTVTFTAGGYHFQCDAHATQMFGDFTVTAATGPTITPHVTPAPNANGWNHTSVAVTWTLQTDSEITSSTGCDETDVATETAGQDVTCEATDDSGTASKTVTVRIDETPPDTTIDGKPANPSTSTAPTFSFSSNEAGATFTCSLDGGPTAACASPKTYSGVPKRSHVFAVGAVDLAGNADQTPASYAWTNGSVPKTKFSTKPAKLTGANASFSFASSDPGALFTCHVDAAVTSGCVSPYQANGLATGPHTFSVVTTDAAGRSGKPLTFSWTVDTTPPETTITKHPTDPTSSTKAVFGWSSSEKKSSFQCSLDAAPFGACQKKGYSGLSPGAHTFGVRATDPAGNTDTTPAEFDWTIS
jgi:large repetitive protein